jgi:selenocysteine-specific elongation factor
MRPPHPTNTPAPPPPGSGKTSLVAALSSTLSTAALDKHPQSRERGITLDLGFSAFSAPLPLHLAGLPFDALQITLVDCPGHASLIRTIAGGAAAGGWAGQ